MKKLTTAILFMLGIVMVTAQAFADIRVNISDGVTTLSSSNQTTGFVLSIPAPKWDATQNGNQTLNILKCSTPPCKINFPSGVVGTTPQAGDTFRIEDISSTNRARIDKIDLPAGATDPATGADSVVLKGIKIFALAGGAGKTFTLTYSTDAGDLTTITSDTGNYLASAKIKGQFRLDTTSPIDGLNGNIAATCTSGENNPCVKLELQVNAITLNGQGSSATGVVTAAVPCVSNSTTSPCGTGGFWSPSLLSGDQFLASDSGSVGCGTSCNPYQKGTLTAKFSAANQVLILQNSAGGGLAADTQDGLIDLALAVGEPGIDQWLASCSADQPLQVQGLPPFGNSGRNQDTANANFPAKFSLVAANLVSATGGFTMESVVDSAAESVLSPGVAAKNNFCLMARIFSSTTRPQLKDIGPFNLSWSDFRVGDFASINSQLGTLSFSDCTACFRVEIDLLKDAIDAGTLNIYLGSSGPNNTTIHDGTTPPLDFFTDPAFRVDASGIDPLGTLPGVAPQPCCITFASAASNSNYGKLLVKAVRIVLESDPQSGQDNHQVAAVKAVVDGNSSSDQLLVVSPTYTPSCNWPPADGLKLQVYNVSDPADRHWVKTIVNPIIDQCTLKADINVAQMGSGTYEVEVSAFSAASNPDQEFVGGVPLAFPGIMILK